MFLLGILIPTPTYKTSNIVSLISQATLSIIRGIFLFLFFFRMKNIYHQLKITNPQWTCIFFCLFCALTYCICVQRDWPSKELLRTIATTTSSAAQLIVAALSKQLIGAVCVGPRELRFYEWVLLWMSLTSGTIVLLRTWAEGT